MKWTQCPLAASALPNSVATTPLPSVDWVASDSDFHDVQFVRGSVSGKLAGVGDVAE